VHLDVAIGHEGDVADETFLFVDRGQCGGVFVAQGQDVAVEAVHFGHVGRAQIDVVQFEFHVPSVAESCAGCKLEGQIMGNRLSVRSCK